MVTRLVKGTALLCSLAGTSQAIGETMIGADVSANAQYSSNPYSSTTGKASSASAVVSADPFVLWRTEKSTTRLSGNINHTEYSRIYDSTTNFGANLAVDTKLDPRTGLRFGLGFSSAILNSNQLALSPVVGNGGIVDPNLPPVLDPVLANGFRDRQITYQGDASIDRALSARDRVNVGISGAATRFNGNNGNLREYNYGRGQIGYQRSLNARLSIGASMSVAVSDYLSRRQGDGTIYSPQLTVNWQPNSRWTINAAAGVSLSDQHNIVGKEQTTSFSGSLSACELQSLGSLCITASRSVVPSSLAGLSTQTSLGASYSRRLSERTTASLFASYSRSSESNGTGASTLDYLSSNASLSRRLSPRLSAFVSAGYTDSFKSVVNRPANYFGSVGVKMRIGSLR
ncbi:hypothetical protein [Sphingobium subterraneum]|uniref:Uncharacterized protein n=1 Tax=Sphingobium subterraneum TaxID=627688 RepID=A0A841J1F4_9SPHN|nr:hypothetical protein [Sphingobium subterraneum]MBB6122495.1 hypothetical protein [Sphingobium subterraneum]